LTAGDGSRNQAALAELWDEVLPIPEYIDGRDRRAVVFQLAPAGCVVSCRQDPTGTLLAQVVGRSRVKIVPSWDLPLWDDGRPASSPPDRGGPAPESGLPPDRPQVLECLLNPGDLLFRPIGCWHSLEVLEAAATLSFSRFAFDDDPVPVH
jgi:hypothetical protein